MQRVRDALRTKTERAGPCFKGDAAIAVNHVEAVGPARVIALSSVVKAVNHRRKMYAEFDDAHLAHLFAFREIFGAGEDDVVVQIVGILPDVAGMGFANVYDVERNAVLILFVELVEVGNLPPERRSGVTSKNQDDRFLAAHG